MKYQVDCEICKGPMTPENAQIMPEMFMCDKCVERLMLEQSDKGAAVRGYIAASSPPTPIPSATPDPGASLDGLTNASREGILAMEGRDLDAAVEGQLFEHTVIQAYCYRSPDTGSPEVQVEPRLPHEPSWTQCGHFLQPCFVAKTQSYARDGELSYDGVNWDQLKVVPAYSSDLNLAHEVARAVVEKVGGLKGTFRFLDALFEVFQHDNKPGVSIDLTYRNAWLVFDADPTTICKAALLSCREAVVTSPQPTRTDIGNLDSSESAAKSATTTKKEGEAGLGEEG